MTFIASVIARNGIVVLADSLTTSTTPMVTLQDINTKFPTNDAIPKEELIKLIKGVPVYSHQNAEKLFELDKHTILTTTGIASLNDLVIKDLIEKFKNTYDSNKSVENKIHDFVTFLTTQSKEHITKAKVIYDISFILSCYNLQKDKYEIYQIKIAKTTEDAITADANLQFITFEDLTNDKVVCGGQIKLTNKLLLGSSLDVEGIIQYTVGVIANSNPDKTNAEVIKSLVGQIMQFPEIKAYIEAQKELFNIRELEVQEAVDFVCLLYRMVTEFQKYMYKFPDVGGQIKVGIIQKNTDFKIISNNEIKMPNFIE